jgi:hypothetical protein
MSFLIFVFRHFFWFGQIPVLHGQTSLVHAHIHGKDDSTKEAVRGVLQGKILPSDSAIKKHSRHNRTTCS